MTISTRAAAIGLLLGCGFGGGFVLSGVARQRSTLPQFRKADPGQMARMAAGAVMTGAAASATSGKDDGSATAILSDVAAAGGTGRGKGDGTEALGVGAGSAKGGGKDGGAAGGAKDGSLAQKAHSEGKTAPGDGDLAAASAKAAGSGLSDLVSKAAASDAPDPAAKAGVEHSPGPGSKTTAATGTSPDGPCRMADFAGAEAAAVLSGNTVEQDGDGGARSSCISHRAG